MKQTFPGYYKLSAEEFDTLWKNCVFVLDASVLLNLYRYPQQASNDLLTIFSNIADRLWIPYQVALEFHRNRPTVIAEQKKRFHEVRDALDSARKNLKSQLDKLELKKRHSSINPDPLIEKLDALFTELLKNLDELESNKSTLTIQIR